MKKLFTIIMMLMCLTCMAQVKFEGNVVTTTSTTRGDSTLTKYIWEDSNKNQYQIILSSKGSAYVWRTSKKGKKYRQYLGVEISKAVCKKCNKKYEGKE